MVLPWLFDLFWVFDLGRFCPLMLLLVDRRGNLQQLLLISYSSHYFLNNNTILMCILSEICFLAWQNLFYLLLAVLQLILKTKLLLFTSSSLFIYSLFVLRCCVSSKIIMHSTHITKGRFPGMISWFPLLRSRLLLDLEKAPFLDALDAFNIYELSFMI